MATNPTDSRYEDIIASIVEVAVYKLDGVASLNAESGSTRGKMFSTTKGVSVFISGEKASIEVSINAYANYEISSLAYDIQQSIIKDVESSTKYKVKNVNVNVVGVVFPE